MATYPWSGKGKKLTNYDIPRVGHSIGVGEDEIHAVLDVETRGTGFDDVGVIRLFEEHVFYRRLPKEKRSKAVALGLAHPSWRRNYADNYNRLLRAYAFDPKAALEACSWGLGQVMGCNYKLAGYLSALEMVNAFAVSEAEQLKGMVAFIRNTGLDAALRAHNWAKFAEGYNGKGYRANQYHTRLADRYRFWSGKPDTPWTPASAAEESRVAEVAIKKAAPLPVEIRPAPPGGQLVKAVFRLIQKLLGGN